MSVATCDYQAFLESKVVVAAERGSQLPVKLNSCLYPHQRDICSWAIRGGNRAIFASWGLGKTLMQVQLLQSVLDSHEGSGLIVCPLGVKAEFVRDAREFFQIEFQYVRTNEEYEEMAGAGYRFFISNYERIRDGQLDPNRFVACSLDEASVLRSFGSKTYQTFLTLFNEVPFKWVATATPSPNRYKELIHYAGFLGIMDTGQALTRFFKRDSTQAGNLTIHPHKEREFWLWVSTWATFLTKPSDLGYDDCGYDLPPLTIHKHRLPVDHTTAGFDSWGQGKLLRNAATSLSDAAREKRDSLVDRVAKLLEIIYDDPTRTESEVLCGTPGTREGEMSGLEQASPGKVCIRSSVSGERTGARESMAAHPSRTTEGPTAQSALSDPCGVQSAADSTEQGVRYLRNDRERRQEALSVSGPQPYNRGGAGAVMHGLQSGVGQVSGQSRASLEGGRVPEQFIVWCTRNDEQRAVERLLKSLGTSFSSLDGSMDIDKRELELDRWRSKETTAFISKPVMYGAGVNLQQCHVAIFLGLDYKFQDFIQAIARLHRFLQTEPVEVHLIYTESEDAIYDTLMAKWKRHEELVANMSRIIQEYGLNNAKHGAEMRRSIGVQRQEVKGEFFTAVNNDNIPEMDRFSESSVDLVVTSWPFSNHYEYTEKYNDFGHNTDDDRFFDQMDFLTPKILRALRPGRLYCVHCKDRLLYGSVTGLGMYSVNPFSDKCVAHLQKHGLIYCGRITIVTDVVRENNQTYRLGWTEKTKDGTKMGVGSPEYILLFRKLPTDTSRAYADTPVVKTKEEYTRSRWQFDASPFWRSRGDRFLSPEEIQELPQTQLRSLWHEWNSANVYDFSKHVAIAEALEAKGLLPASFMLLDPTSHSPWCWSDVVRMRTLNTDQARKRVEGHICPLQFDVVERLVETYSMKGELVLDPFAGLMTVPYIAVKMERRGYGIELNSEYWADGVGYCRAAEQKRLMPTLFDVAKEMAPEVAP